MRYELGNGIMNQSNNSYSRNYATEGWLFREQYDYDGRYFVSASFRRDDSSCFHPDHRWGNFWSVGAGWLLSKERFLENQSWIDPVSYTHLDVYKRQQVINTSGQPGENAQIRIRGIGSFSASSAPLYVVDGMPYDEESVNALNPADIESMSILKDAASASLYGSRAANGVVMITTKKGMVDKSKVTLDARWGVNTRGVPEYDIMKDQREYVLTAWNTLKNQSTGAEASEGLIGSIGYNPFIGVANNAMVSADGVVSSAALRHNDDWADAALHNGMRQEYNLSLQGLSLIHISFHSTLQGIPMLLY